MIDILKMPYVQKVLPLVYDESLSYYELLCKVAKKLNDTIDELNEQGEDVAQLKVEMAEVKYWIDHFDVEGFARLTGADFLGNVTTTGSMSAAQGFTGNLTGDVTGDVTGDLTGDVTGNVTGDLTGNVVGNVRGNVTGILTGSVNGDVNGNVRGNVTGNVAGNVNGTLTGDSHGTHYGGVVGNVVGNVTGDVTGDVSGNAGSADVLSTPRDIMVDLAADSSEAFDGSDNVDIGVKGVLPVSHGGTGSNSFDTAPTAGSTKPVTSGGIKTALDGKQDELTFDVAPTEGSTNPVTSGGVYSAISQAGVGVVSSVFGRTGVIIAGDGDYRANQIVFDGTTSGLSATRVQAAIDEVVDKLDDLPNSLAGLDDVTVNAPTNGQILKYDATANKWVNTNETVGIAPDNVSDIAVVAGDGTLTIKWSDPDDTVVEGQTICTWSKTKLVMKTGSYPSNEDDGTLVVTNSVRNQYAVNGYQITGLVNDTTYYFQLFPISDGNAVNRNVANRGNGTPKDVVSVTLTINGGYEDTILIKDSNDDLLATCVFATGQISGTCQLNIPAGGLNCFVESTVYKTDASTFFRKSVALTDNPAQTVNAYPDVCWYWYGRKCAGDLIHGYTAATITYLNNRIRLDGAQYGATLQSSFNDTKDVSACTTLHCDSQFNFSDPSSTPRRIICLTNSAYEVSTRYADISFPSETNRAIRTAAIPSGLGNEYATIWMMFGDQYANGALYSVWAD